MTSEIVRLAAPAMGTHFELVLLGEDAGKLRSAGEAALAEVCEQSERLSAFGRGSMLSFINSHAAEIAVAVDRELFELLSICRKGWLLSEGAFDITVGPLMEAWGFRGGSPGRVAEASWCVGMDKVELDEARGTVRFACPGVRLDLGGVAKGWALDIAGGILREAGVTSAIMHGGTSSVLAIGPPGECGWGVKVEHQTIRLRDRSLSVSAPRGRVIDGEHGVFGHVLDPRVGAPIEGAEFACTICDSGVWAEVWSKALLVLKKRPAGMPRDVEALVSRGQGAPVERIEEGEFA
jgi:FAD:protein FMN transferase